jgi:hypothetical protein
MKKENQERFYPRMGFLSPDSSDVATASTGGEHQWRLGNERPSETRKHMTSRQFVSVLVFGDVLVLAVALFILRDLGAPWLQSITIAANLVTIVNLCVTIFFMCRTR